MSSIAVISLSILFLIRLLPTDRIVGAFAAHVDQLGVSGPIVFVAFYTVAASLFFPAAAMTLAAGAVFGLWKGTVLVSAGATGAAAVSFLIGRYLARDAVRAWAKRHPRFDAIDRAIGKGGWKIIALLRLSPAVPFSISNYLFGITSVRFWPYVLTSWIAMLPGTFMYVYLGYAGGASLDAAAGTGGRSAGQWALLIVGLIATVAVTVYVTRLARNAVKAETQDEPDSQADSERPMPEESRSSRNGPTLALAAVAIVVVGCTAAGYLNKGKIGKLFGGPPGVTLKETYEAKPDGPTFDHSGFDAVLKRSVNAAGLVDYRALQADPSALDAYVRSLADAPFEQMGRDQKLALLLNAYNAFTLRLILDHLPLKSIKDIPADQRWDAVRWNIGGTTWSLNQIEHEQIRPHFKEPRIHFALVCAAIGCPPLRNEAYEAARLDEQLEGQSTYVHSHDRWFRFDPATSDLKLTSLYKWYGGDFEQVAPSVQAFAAQYAPPLQSAIEAGAEVNVSYLDYDWSLNRQPDVSSR